MAGTKHNTKVTAIKAKYVIAEILRFLSNMARTCLQGPTKNYAGRSV